MSKQSELNELKKEKVKIEEKIALLQQNKVPQPLKNINWKPLIDTCNSVIKEIDDDGYEDDDSSHYIYEEAMMAIFGPDIFQWINKRIDE